MATFTNYLQLKDRLTQVWVNKYTLILVLAIFKLFFFAKSISREFDSLKQYIINNCHSIDLLYDKIAHNTPHYVCKMGNFMTEKTMEEAVKATLEILSLIVLASESLLTFVIDLYLGTYACLIVSAVDGTVDIATNTTEKLLGAVNSTISSVANELDDGLEDISEFINKILSAASKVEDFFTDNDDEDPTTSNDIHKVNLTIDSLRNLYIPSSINDKLEKLAANTPNFDTVKNETKTLIAEPFQYVRGKIAAVNSTDIMGNATEMLYVPPLERVAENGTGICSSNKPAINEFFHGLNKSIREITKIFIILLIIAALLAIIWECWQECRQWYLMKQLRDNYEENFDFWYNNSVQDKYEESSSSSFEKHGGRRYKNGAGFKEEKFDILSTYQQTFHRWQTLFASGLTRILVRNSHSNSKVQKIQWFVAYITSERVLFLLGIGLLGIVISCLQLIILSVLKKEVHNIKVLKDDISNTQMMHTFKQDMQLWSLETNNYINQTENNINTEIFGWIETTTTSINDTVNTMVTGIDDTLADIFNGTLLYHPMQSVVKCVIEDKLYAVEKAMTWIHKKAHVSIPRINDTQILQLATDVNDGNNTTSEDNNSKNTMHDIMSNMYQELHMILLEIVRKYHDSIIAELLISVCIVSLWVLQIPVGLLILTVKCALHKSQPNTR